jgi:mRNA interferase YafQ
MLTLRRISQFKKDYKRCVKRGCEIEKLHAIIELLANGKKLDAKYRDHSLLGDYRDCRECHIEPDWLLIYRLTEYELILIRTGTHTDLFE